MKPMLAATYKEGHQIKFPVYVSPKIDGVRCIGIDGVALSRSLKPIPNKYVQSVFADGKFNGFDGELVVGPPNHSDVYRTTESAVMSEDGKPDFRFIVFDDICFDNLPYETRYEYVCTCFDQLVHLYEYAEYIHSRKVSNLEDLLSWEEEYLQQGYEGIMYRSIDGKYKFGRSTLNEGGLVKLKRFTDSEAIIIGFVERMKNNNEQTTNELGYATRSSHKANKVGAGMVGTILARDIKTGQEVEVGTGFTHEFAKHMWKNTEFYTGKIIKYKHFAHGVKDKPRHPVFLGFRSEIDL